MTNTTSQMNTVPPLPVLENFAAELSEPYSQEIQSAFITSMSEFHEQTTSILNVEYEKMKDPAFHKRTTLARLCIAGLSVNKARALYRDTLDAYSKAVALLANELENVSEPFIDTLTASLRAVNHHPQAVADFLIEYIAPVNETRDGLSWQVGDQGNKHYYQRAKVLFHGNLIFTIFFDLKVSQEKHDYVLIDAAGGDAAVTWEWLRHHVETLDVAISRVDTAIDVKSEGSFDNLLLISQSHRVGWSQSVVPNYGSINIDNPKAGRTAYFGKIPGKKGGRAGTFTIRIYDKGLQLLSEHSRDALADMSDQDLQNYARIECSASPGTSEEKKAMAENMCNDVCAAWGYRAFTSELLERIIGLTVNRIKPHPKVVKSPQEKKEWLLTQYAKMLREFYHGESILELIYDLHLYSGVQLDTYGIAEHIITPEDSERRYENYLEFKDHLENFGGHSIASATAERTEFGKQLNEDLAAGDIPSKSMTMVEKIASRKNKTQESLNVSLSNASMLSTNGDMADAPPTPEEDDAKLGQIYQLQRYAAEELNRKEFTNFKSYLSELGKLGCEKAIEHYFSDLIETICDDASFEHVSGIIDAATEQLFGFDYPRFLAFSFAVYCEKYIDKDALIAA